ncbi:hypothetical protein [Sphingobacterium cavernae]|uniref:hypothetical protein n=1 Tax=Sphingobacterium cavernae TaxID=2592657 RepID=UPI00122FC5AD|nr:hypothetical protein [Sphingobacterium cavernae]
MKYLLLFAFIIFGNSADSQHNRTTTKKSSIINTNEDVAFYNYAFVVDDIVIDRNKLIDYPKAEIYDLFPNSNTIGGKSYSGVLYFKTNADQIPYTRYADDPAWFLNGKQISSFNIRETSPEYYTHIVKSLADTIINDRLYKGSIHILTEENYFDIRTSFKQILLNYNDIDPKETMLFWFRSVPKFTKINDIGVFETNFAINYLDNGDLKKLRIDSLQLVNGRKYVFQIKNGGNRFAKSSLYGTSNKSIAIFKKPLMIDTECACYLSEFNTDSIGIFQSVEIMPIPYDGEKFYLQKLSSTLKILNNNKSTSAVLDSINVSFLITDIGLLTRLHSNSSNTNTNSAILHAIKRNACLWTPGVQSGIPVNTQRNMIIYYNKDQEGSIMSFDKIKYL